MKKILALASAGALALALTACASDTTDDQPTAMPTEPTEQETATPTGPVELELGETAHLVQGANGPRDITVTVDDITVSDQCHQGLNSYSDDYYNDHGYFIQVTGEFEVIDHQVNFSVSDWTGTTADGYAVTFNPASECDDPHYDMPGYQSFSDPIDAGQKARAVEEFWVEELPESLILDAPYEPHAYSWPVPQEVSESPTDSAEQGANAVAPEAPNPTPAPQAPAPAPAPAPQPDPVIGMTGAPGADTPAPMDKQIQECLTDPTMYQPGTTVFTDGTTGWTEQCAAQ